MDDTVQVWAQRLRSVPPALQQHLSRLVEERASLCEETLLSLWCRQPALFGGESVVLLERLERLTPALRFRLQLALAASGRSSSRPPQVSLQMRDALGHPAFEPQQPATLLTVLGRSPCSLLRRAAGAASAQLWPEPWSTEVSVDRLSIGSGPYHGTKIPIQPGQRLCLGRSGAHCGSLAHQRFAIADQSIPTLRAGRAPPLQLQLGDGTLSLEISQVAVHWQQELWEFGPPLVAQACLPLAAGAHALRVGSTLLRLHVPPRQRRPLRIFLSHARADTSYAAEALRHLRHLEQQGAVALWYRGKLGAGSWREEAISEGLNAADVILILLSPDYHCEDDLAFESLRVQEIQAQGGAAVWPILLRPVIASAFSPRLPVGEREPTNEEGFADRAISLAAHRDHVWVEVLREVLREHSLELDH